MDGGGGRGQDPIGMEIRQAMYRYANFSCWQPEVLQLKKKWSENVFWVLI